MPSPSGHGARSSADFCAPSRLPEPTGDDGHRSPPRSSATSRPAQPSGRGEELGAREGASRIPECACLSAWDASPTCRPVIVDNRHPPWIGGTPAAESTTWLEQDPPPGVRVIGEGQ
jgi:hypothetical protein